MAAQDNPYKWNIEYYEEKEETPFNPSIHKSQDDYTILPKTLGPHTGYYRLCVIREKQRDWQEVMRLAEQAKSGGWAGDWDKRIEKAKKKLENPSGGVTP